MMSNRGEADKLSSLSIVNDRINCSIILPANP